MELQTISQVSKQFGISTRTLRYYEQIGLIDPVRKEDSNYRSYKDETLLRLRQIIVLRKLRIPLKQITEIIHSNDVTVAIEAFERNLADIEDEITALSTIRNVVKAFIRQLNLDKTKLALLDDDSLLEVVDALTVSKINFKEDKSMDDLNKANERLGKITDRDIRIILLPPSAVASALGTGENAEHDADVIMGKFKDDVLSKTNPSTRFFGFNNPVFTQSGEFVKHQYEVWAAIPDDMPVPAPLIKKQFKGGLYIAYTSKPVSFDDWKRLKEWLDNNDDFAYDNSRAYRDDKLEEHMPGHSGWGCLEEHFNSYNIYGLADKRHIITHIDFLTPVKEKLK